MAAVFGVIDYSRIASSSKAWSKASLHGLINFILLICFGVLFGLKLARLPELQFASGFELILQGCLIMGLVYSNYLGADLLFKHKIGLNEE